MVGVNEAVVWSEIEKVVVGDVIIEGVHGIESLDPGVFFSVIFVEEFVELSSSVGVEVTLVESSCCWVGGVKYG